VTGPMPQPLAIYYGWPSLVNGSSGDVAHAADQFRGFAAAIFGEACPTRESDPRGRAVAEHASNRCRVYGYVSLGHGRSQPGWTCRELRARLEQWSQWGAVGVLLDCAGRDYGVSAKRMADAVAAAHDLGLQVVINAWDPFDVLGSRAELSMADALLAENDVLRHGMWRPLASFRGRVARVEVARRELGVAVWAVATLGPVAPASYCSLTTRIVGSWRSAGGDTPALLGLADPLYGAADNRLPLPRPLPDQAMAADGPQVNDAVPTLAFDPGG
jgi:hypothetical protein